MARPRNQAEQKCLSDGRWDARWRDRHIRAVAADVKLRILYESIPPSRALACKTRLPGSSHEFAPIRHTVIAA